MRFLGASAIKKCCYVITDVFLTVQEKGGEQDITLLSMKAK